MHKTLHILILTFTILVMLLSISCSEHVTTLKITYPLSDSTIDNSGDLNVTGIIRGSIDTVTIQIDDGIPYVGTINTTSPSYFSTTIPDLADYTTGAHNIIARGYFYGKEVYRDTVTIILN